MNILENNKQKFILNANIKHNNKYDYSKVTISFTQEKKAEEFCFDYFFNIQYEKI